MPNNNNSIINKPSLFSPSVIRSIIQDNIDSPALIRQNFELLSSSSLDHTSSFKYNLPGYGLTSTQQLNIDWSDFVNHTFFNSANVKTNVAFRKIFNQYPFDGTQREIEIFLDELTGFEKWVYDQFPKNKGYLFFSGTNPSEINSNGTYITVKDVAGVAYPGISKNLTGKSILNPNLNSMTIEFWLYLPQIANSASCIMSKLNPSTIGFPHGFEIGCNATGSISNALVSIGICSGSSYVLGADINCLKGQWNHLAYVWDRNPNQNLVYGFLNGENVTNSTNLEFGIMNIDSINLTIGSGSAINFGAVPLFTPITTLSGAIDEIRIWHSARTQEEIQTYLRKPVDAQENLKLYFKLNEPSGSQTPVVLDYSGNSLHGQLSSWAESNNIRNILTGSLIGDSPVTYEKLKDCPVLFPMHPEVEELNTSLLETANEFDQINPNRIDRLIPKHYLQQGEQEDGLTSEEGDIIDQLSLTGTTSDTVKLGSTQIILMLLYTWAKFFDEIKLYLQAFGDLIHLDYDSVDTIPDTFLQVFAEKAGITLPPLFTGSSIGQFINAENIDSGISRNDYSLQYIQNQIWKRMLLNLQDILKSKGTIHSVKSFIRSVGIEPDNNFRIREFGGPTTQFLQNTRENRSEVSTLLNFISGGLITSPYLSQSRVEPGIPHISSSTIGPNDGLLTSGSWTFEGVYRFPSTSSLTSTTQSLVRMLVTGSSFADPGLIISNLVAIQDRGLILYSIPGTSVISDTIIDLSNIDIFDGDPWHISFGVRQGIEFNSNVSSSIFLRASKQSFGEVVSKEATSSYVATYVNHTPPALINFWSELGTTRNPSGSFLEIGTNASIGINNAAFFIKTSDSGSYNAKFEGKAGQFKFWSKYVSDTEWIEHTRNFKSLGVSDPTTNFNFVTNKSGSWERLRMDVSTDQPITSSNSSGFLQVMDFSQNNLHWSGSFPITSSVVVPQRFQYSLISPKFDVGSTTNKVRVRSFSSYENILSSSYAEIAPVYFINPSEKPQDDTRFTIDFSIVDALDQDIVNIFGTLDILDNILGNPELMFSPDYPGLEVLRDIYFNRLTDRINLKNFFEFYKWFDTNIGSFISQLIPRKTKFLGVNFCLESPMLERHKIEYFSSDIYLGTNVRLNLENTILFQEISANFNRY